MIEWFAILLKEHLEREVFRLSFLDYVEEQTFEGSQSFILQLVSRQLKDIECFGIVAGSTNANILAYLLSHSILLINNYSRIQIELANY